MVDAPCWLMPFARSAYGSLVAPASISEAMSISAAIDASFSDGNAPKYSDRYAPSLLVALN